MVAALPAQEELIFCFHSCAQARPHCACQQHSDPNFSRGYLYSVSPRASRLAESTKHGPFMADPTIRSDRPTEIIKKSGRPEACIRGNWDNGPYGLESGYNIGVLD
jgi:hypothetical protein